MSKEFGIARNTASAQAWLDQCDAVSIVEELNDEWLEFAFDPSIEVFAVPDHLVWFDQGAAPAEATEILNARHNTSDDEEWLKRLLCRIASGDQDMVAAEFQKIPCLDNGWDWGDVLNKLQTGEITREDIEYAIHAPLC
jgi:hypothetical protein